MPAHDDEGLRDLAHALGDDADDVGEVLLADGDLLWVKICDLELGEEELRGGHVVAVGAEEHEGDSEPLQEPLRPRVGVVAGVVPHDDGVLPPAYVLLVQHLDEFDEVDLHDLRIAVGLEEGEEDAAEVVDAGDEGESGVDDDLLLPRTTCLRLPATSLIANAIQPALVDVDEAALVLEEPEEDEGALLPQEEVLRGVGLSRQADDAAIAKLQLLVHDVANVMLLKRYAGSRFELLPHLSHRPELYFALHLVLDELDELEVLLLLLRPLRDQLPEELRLPPDLADEGGDDTCGYSILPGHLPLGLAVDDDVVGHLQLLLQGESLRGPPSAPKADGDVIDVDGPLLPLLSSLQRIMIAADPL